MKKSKLKYAIQTTNLPYVIAITRQKNIFAGHLLERHEKEVFLIKSKKLGDHRIINMIDDLLTHGVSMQEDEELCANLKTIKEIDNIILSEVIEIYEIGAALQMNIESSDTETKEIDNHTKPTRKKNENKLEEVQLIPHLSIEELNLSRRSYRVLKLENINTLSDIMGNSEEKLLKMPNFGKTCLMELKQKLKKFKIKLNKK